MSKLILLSDIHLENKTQEAANFVLKTINDKIDLEKDLGESPIVVLAGDIHNGIKGYEWMSKISAPVVYVAGNHEYWGGDFYEINESLQKNAPTNVNYLYNKALIIEDIIFLGSTLWTDVAEKTNPDLSQHCTFVMNDSFRSTAKKWYESLENIEKLNKLTSRADEFITEKRWNILIEREENEKTQKFYKAFNAINYFFKSHLNNEKSNLKSNLDSSYSPLLKSEYDEKMINLMAFKGEISFKSYMALNDNFARPYGNSYLPKELLSPNEFFEDLFALLKNQDLKDKKVVVVSHHLPFMEEILVGTHRAMTKKNGSYLPKMLNEVNENIFLINEGVNYPFHNYFWQCSKGEIDKDQDITKIAHYCNSGSKMFSSSFLESINTWVHGHEHHYNFIDFLKGVKVAANPMGYALHGLSFAGSEPVMNAAHVGDTEKEQLWELHIERIKKEVIQEVFVEKNYSSFYNQQAEIWAWYLWSKESYLDELKEAIYLNKKLFSLISKKIQNKKYDLFEMKTYAVALNSFIDNLLCKRKDLAKAIAVRKDVDFSYQNHAYGLIPNNENLSLSLNLIGSSEFTKININFLKEHFEFDFFGRPPVISQYGLKELFYNSAHFAYAQKRIESIKDLLKSIHLESPQDVSIELIEIFYGIEGAYDFNAARKISEKIEKRYASTLAKLVIAPSVSF